MRQICKSWKQPGEW